MGKQCTGSSKSVFNQNFHIHVPNCLSWVSYFLTCSIITNLKAISGYENEVAELGWKRQIKEERNQITRKIINLLFLFETSFFYSLSVRLSNVYYSF